MHDCSDFSRALDLGLAGDFHTTAAEATPAQLHAALAKAVLASVSPAWRKSQRLHENARRACYFSAEFLVGRAVYNNLLCLGMTGEAEQLLAARGVDLGVLEEIEDAALGNGGLGRLAACFLDSAATMNLPLDGYGIRYRYGLFRQTIENGFQREQVDDWTRQGDPWSLRCESEAVPVVFFDQTVTAVPYDMPIFGYGTRHVSTLRLWQAEPAVPFDFALFNEQKYAEALADADRAEDISRILYPNDTTPAGKRLRLKQQYFFCCASLQDILRAQKRAHGNDLTRLGDFVSIQLNDTHPVVSIPELLRLLIDVEGMTFDAAFAIARQVFCYTNHTIMSEALEKWDLELMRAVLPRIAELIAEIDARLGAELETRGVPDETARRMRIVQDGRIHMAYLAVYASRTVNGVAQLHTEILTGSLLRDWYALWPERFQNKTNGVTQRRWLALCNPELSALLTELLGDDGWKTELPRLRALERYADDPVVLRRFLEIKRKKRQDLADYLQKRDHLLLDPDTIFDVQIKRLHEYKRQLLNILTVLELYFEIREGSLVDFAPTTFLFGAKSAPGYDRAKGIIKLINEVAAFIARDPAVSRVLKVVFVPNYNVSSAERLVAAADVSEQISTAGTEASGTGNMKMMLNGAVTVGTYDGANVEIVAEAGRENVFIFGATVEELAAHTEEDPKARYERDPHIRRTLDALIDGTLDDQGSGAFADLRASILTGSSWQRADPYAILLDFEPYLEIRKRLNREFSADPLAVAHKAWLNLCRSGKFSSDRTIGQYAADIWRIEPVAQSDEALR